MISACNPDRKPISKTTTPLAKSSAKKPIENNNNQPLMDIPWSAVSDSSGNNFSMKKSAANDTITLTRQNVINSLNMRYPDIQASFSGSRNDTITIAIPDATSLTQQSGTSGANIYFAESTYSLTEIKGVRYVKFLFEEGDHASPKTFSRASFQNKNLVK